MFKNKIVLPLIAVAVIGSGSVYAANSAHAQSAATTPFSGLVKEIATKFGLDEAKVQTVVSEYHDKQRSEMEKTREADMTSRLDTLVKEGKITEAQKQAIIAKHQEIKSSFNPESMKDLTPEERRTQMQKMHDELSDWAKSQGIDLQYVMPFKVMMKGPHGMHGGFMKDRIVETPTPTS